MSLEVKPIELLSPSNYIPEITEAIQSFWSEEWMKLHSRDEDELLLYHYTTLSGLKGMLENRSIWCSHITSLNDPNENYYGQELVSKKLHIAIEEEQDCFVKDFLKEILSNIEYFNEKFYHPYVACFCQEDNLLSQWRSYANYGGGYSLGFYFNSDTKHSLTSNDKNNSLFLRCLIYNSERQNLLIEKCLSVIREGVKGGIQKQNDNLPIGWISQAAMHASNIFFDLIWSFKNPAFSEEKEWRLIKVMAAHNKPELLNFRENACVLIPYLNTFIFNYGEGSKFFPLKSIRFGPSLDPIRTKASIELLLHKCSVIVHDILIKPNSVTILDAGYKLR